MSRWKSAARRGKHVDRTICGSCNVKASAKTSLTVDSSDGHAYCAACWRSYYGSEPEASAREDDKASPDSAGGFWDSARDDDSAGHPVASSRSGAGEPRSVLEARRPADELPDVQEAMPERGCAEAAAARGADPEGGKAAGTDDTEQAADLQGPVQPILWRKGRAGARAVPSAGGAELCGACAVPLPEGGKAAGAGDAEQAGDVQGHAQPQGALAHFWEQAAELRRSWAASNAGEEADARQLEEFETLQMIYGEALQLLSSEGERPRMLRLELPTEVPAGSRVSLFITMPEGEVPAGSVTSLPPVALLAALPGDYPLEGAGPPALALDAEHLGTGCLSDLEQTLRDLAAQRPGEAVLFDLAAALQEGLAPPERLVLGEEGGGAMEVALRLLAHDHRVRDDQRQREVQVCPMCFDDVVGSRGLFLECDHFACRSCLEQMVQIHVSEGDAQSLRCPVPDCRKPFGSGVVREVFGSDAGALAKWEELTFQRCLEQMQDVVFCPRCDADGEGHRTPCIEDEDHMACCGVCGFVFCGRCRGIYHPGVECSTLDGRVDALEARARGQGPEAAAARDELLTLRHLARTTKRCPRCETAIEKTEGCSKVHCGNCKVYFCWRCGKEISGYDHFATTECRLFDDEEIRRWNERAHTVDRAQARAHEARFLANFIDPEKLWQEARGCPRCRSVVVREGRNNHMRCHACQTHFCGRCSEVLHKNRASEHFGKLRVCPQHSDD